MDLTAEIKNKEESLSALMSRVLKEPLAPLNKSIDDTMGTLLDAKDILDEIDLSIKTSSHEVEKHIKSLRSSLSLIKDEVLPDHERRFQLQVKKLSDATATKVQESIDSHQKSMGALEAVWSANHDTVLIELNANKELSQNAFSALAQQYVSLNDSLVATHKTALVELNASRELSQHAFATVTQHCSTSSQSLAANLQKTTDLISNAITTQQLALEARHQTLLELFGTTSNNLSDIQKSLTDLTTKHEVNEKSLVILKDSSNAISAQLANIGRNSTTAIEVNQAAVTLALTEQNAKLTRHIALVQAQVKTLTLMTGVFLRQRLVTWHLTYGVSFIDEMWNAMASTELRWAMLHFRCEAANPKPPIQRHCSRTDKTL